MNQRRLVFSSLSRVSFLFYSPCSLYQRPYIKSVLKRSFSQSLGKGFDVLDDPSSMKTMITAYGDHEFMVNNVFVKSSVLLFPNSFLQWKISDISELSIDSLRIFTILYPSLQLLLIGTGKSMIFPHEPKAQGIVDFFRKQGVKVEFLSSNVAATTFNFLNQEDRNVAAALLPLLPQDVEEDERNMIYRGGSSNKELGSGSPPSWDPK
jgi:uncharacterized protein